MRSADQELHHSGASQQPGQAPSHPNSSSPKPLAEINREKLDRYWTLFGEHVDGVLREYGDDSVEENLLEVLADIFSLDNFVILRQKDSNIPLFTSEKGELLYVLDLYKDFKAKKPSPPKDSWRDRLKGFMNFWVEKNKGIYIYYDLMKEHRSEIPLVIDLTHPTAQLPEKKKVLTQSLEYQKSSFEKAMREIDHQNTNYRTSR